ncbi:CBF/NF-Y family transcription factor [Dissoconium aciculare CBS 342.82]|uniref:NCT transcriptional regulatory complex subunit B n=1 Tax=Dissoconium aciculare CBS 342.82 TaxID=1314786 RepID=A0A6J3M005_9PEZI|nr:CBF/NF-Y family transcription factor [Dissoconium aciculare CBS 342.82]KAF1821258.1 CBF/NF-Y family transcription factor [Dissoconium aciculare CBS 342.82]
MSDKEFGGNDDLSLPKATVGKIITEVLSTNPSLGGTNGNSMSFAKETRDLLIECCVEFITMISAEANEIAEKEAKKTIASEHVTKALEELGFAEYVPELLRVVDQFKSQAANRERKQNKIDASGMTAEELIRAQEELFKSAGDKYNTATPAD